MNISSTAQPQVYYAYINHIILAILGFLSNFYILSAPQCPLGRLIFHSAGFSPCSVTCKTSGCHQNSFKTRRNFDENCCDIWNELLLAPNPSSLKDFAFQCPTTLVGTVSAAAVPTTNTNRLSTASGPGHGHGFPNFWRFSHPSEQLMTGAILGLLSKLGMDKMKMSHYTWLVVSTPLKNISQLNQLGLFFPIYGKVIKFMCQTTKQIPIS